MHISDVLTYKSSAEVVTIAPGASVTALLAALAEHNVGALVVVDGGGVVGIVSERDVVRRLARDGARLLDAAIETIMSREVFACAPSSGVDHVAEIMTQRRIRHMPVLDGTMLVGIVSIGDVVSSRIRQLEHDRGQLEQYISG